MRMKIVNFSLLVFLFGAIGCRHSAMEDYHSLVKKETKTNKKVNNVFLDISLGMPSKDFYMYCWSMNQKGLFSEGAGSSSVVYKLVKNELQHPANINFFPEFKDDKISSVWANFQYAGWAPWNKALDSDNLLKDVLALYKKWYPEGNPFITISDKTKGDIYVKVDGNRRIIIGRYDDVQVRADYADLSVVQDKEKIR